MRGLVEAEDTELHVPALCDAEVLSVLRRLLLQRRISVDRAAEALSAYLQLPLERDGHEPLLGRALALRENFGAFDALYVALAEAYAATLTTADGRLARAVRAHLALEVVEA